MQTVNGRHLLALLLWKVSVRFATLGLSSRIWRVVALGAFLNATASGCAALDTMKGWLSSTATPQPVASKPQPAPAPSAPAPPKPKRAVHDPHEQKPPAQLVAIDPDKLIGLNPSAVENVLGAPSKITKSDPALVWTYVSPGCSFQIFFYPDLKTASFHALKYGGSDDKGGQIDVSQACVRNILTAKNNGPG